MLHAQASQGLLIVLQALDAAGKDGTIRHVMGAFNPMGCSVADFKAPTPLELSHDFLWRVHPHAPGRGRITIFNRSHYEGRSGRAGTQTRSEKGVEGALRPYQPFRAVLLADSGVTIRKFYLHISKEEQRVRLEARLKGRFQELEVQPGTI